MKKIYIASSFDLIPDIKIIEKILETNGHIITCKWWSLDGFNMADKKFSDDYTDEDFYNDKVCKLIFERDLKGIKDCHVLLFVADYKKRRYTGANVELGIAIALNKKCLLYGVVNRSAMYYPLKSCYTIEQLLKELMK